MIREYEIHDEQSFTEQELAEIAERSAAVAAKNAAYQRQLESGARTQQDFEALAKTLTES